MHKSNTTVPTETYSTPDTFKHTSSIHTQASKFTQAWTHTHTQSNQWCQDRHLTPADIPPQDGRRFFTAVTLSNRQEETEEDGQAGLEKNQVCCTEWERNAKTSSQDKKKEKWQEQQRSVIFWGQLSHACSLMFWCSTGTHWNNSWPHSPNTSQSQVERSNSARGNQYLNKMVG